MKIIIFITISVIAIYFLSCSNNEVGPSNTLSIQIPLSVGSTWTYAIYDSVAHNADTVKVTVHDKISSTFSGYTYLLLYHYSKHIDSLYAVVSMDTLYYYTTTDIVNPLMKFVFPLKEEQGWHALGYSISVRKENIVVPADTFKNCYAVYQQPNIGNQSGGITYWIVPGVGMVEKHILIIERLSPPANGLTNITWKLLSYFIAK